MIRTQQTFICSACGEEHEIQFRAKAGWEYTEYWSDDWGDHEGMTFVEICLNCHGPSVCIGMKPATTAEKADDDLPF